MVLRPDCVVHPVTVVIEAAHHLVDERYVPAATDKQNTCSGTTRALYTFIKQAFGLLRSDGEDSWVGDGDHREQCNVQHCGKCEHIAEDRCAGKQEYVAP